jgi:hypothetical protein
MLVPNAHSSALPSGAHSQSAQRAELSGAAEESERRFFANLMATIKNGGTAAPAAAAGAKVYRTALMKYSRFFSYLFEALSLTHL